MARSRKFSLGQGSRSVSEILRSLYGTKCVRSVCSRV
jgi:hypothetical protein